MISQDLVTKAERIAFIHERFKKHTHDTIGYGDGVVCLCKGCGMPVQSNVYGENTKDENFAIVENPYRRMIACYIDAICLKNPQEKAEAIIVAWLQHFVPPAYVGPAMQQLAGSGIPNNSYNSIVDIVLMLGHEAIYSFVFEMSRKHKTIGRYPEMKKAYLEKAEEAGQHKHMIAFAQFVDHAPSTDIEAAVQTDPNAAKMYGAWKQNYIQKKGANI